MDSGSVAHPELSVNKKTVPYAQILRHLLNAIQGIKCSPFHNAVKYGTQTQSLTIIANAAIAQSDALHHTSLITPLWPSTSINWPVLIFLVPIRVPTTAGNPYSRATIAP